MRTLSLRRVLRPLASAIALTALASAPSTVFAKEWRTLPPQSALAPSTPDVAAARALADDAPALGIEGLDLVARDTIGAGSTLTVLFEQRWGGLRVLDRGGAVRFEAGAPRHVALEVARSLSVSVIPDLDANEAVARLSAKLGRTIAAAPAELVVLGRGNGVLAWVLDVREDGTRYVVDAHSGALLLRIPVVLDAQGRVYAVNQVETPMPVDVPLATLDTATTHLDGWGGLLHVTNYVSGSAGFGYTLEQTLTPSNGTDFLYNPPQDALDAKDGFAQVNLYYHLTDIREFFTALGLDQTGPKWKLTAVANAFEDGSPLDNAFFSPFGQQDGPFAAPNLISIGQGSVIDFAYDSDVFKHEFGHYIAGNTSNFNLGPFFSNEFGLQALSSGIDEGLADYWACSDNDSPVLGEAALAPFGAQRDLSNTQKRCPDDIGVESHADGELIGSVSWSLRQLLGQARADKLVWGAETMLPPGATFGDFYQGLVTTMKSMQGAGELSDADVNAAVQVLADRGLDDCGPILALDGATPRTTMVQGLQFVSFFLQTDCFQLGDAGFQLQSPFHFSRATSPSDSTLRFSIELIPDFPDDVRGTVFVRRGAHVGYTTDGNGLPVPSEYDWEFPIDGNENMEIVLDASSSPAFAPGDTYFVSVSSSSCANLRTTIQASNDTTTSVTTSATTTSSTSTGSSGTGGEGGAGDKRIVYIDRGCGCVVASEGDAAGAAIAALALAAGAVVRRRRRTR